MVQIPTLKEMIKAGVHLGHIKARSHPKASYYIFGLRNGINIIDLEKTQIMLKKALDYLTKLSQEGKTILMVGAKRQARDIIQQAAESCAMPYVNWRWLGGTLTNFETILANIKQLEIMEGKKNSEEYNKFNKKEQSVFEKKMNRLHRSFNGLKTLKKLPDVLFILDTALEKVAVEEARKMEIPIVGICDTDANPSLIDHPIGANDDAKKSIEMMVNLVAEAVNEGKKEVKSESKSEEDKTKKSNDKNSKS